MNFLIEEIFLGKSNLSSTMIRLTKIQKKKTQLRDCPFVEASFSSRKTSISRFLLLALETKA